MAATCELACDAHCDLGESPIWDERNGGRLYFVVSRQHLLWAGALPLRLRSAAVRRCRRRCSALPI